MNPLVRKDGVLLAMNFPVDTVYADFLAILSYSATIKDQNTVVPYLCSMIFCEIPS